MKIMCQDVCRPRPGSEQIGECDNAWSDKESSESNPNEFAPIANTSRRQCNHENADD
ncbi:hypothetical protein KSD_66730 [Ktedonobacter sp. SOSP1-85]|nr:hypothetical protein KSD_66730 [Ktedonobacter sp. SOSP1-85]